MPQLEKTFDSSELHNQNCYRYLKVLASKMTPRLWHVFTSNISIELNTVSHQFQKVQGHTDYDIQFAYADVYSKLLKHIENNIASLAEAFNQSITSELEPIQLAEEMSGDDLADSLKLKYKQSKATLAQEQSNFDDLIFTIYANDNHNLEHTFDAFKNLVDQGEKFQTKIKKSAISGTRINKKATMPSDANSIPGRLKTTFTSNLRLQMETSSATIRHYRYQQLTNRPIEYRFGTQGQRIENVPRVSPLFQYWLTVLKKKRSDPMHPVDHIYFNNLGLYRTGTEGNKEKALTLQLHNLETTHSNIAMITLPADKFLMDSTHYKQTKAVLEYPATFNELFNIATHTKLLDEVEHDFYISKEIKALLYPGIDETESRAKEEDIISKLLNNSFTAMGLDKTKHLSLAQKQAVWFYFIKFELTDYIIETLQPQSISFVCKDAIDRGGVASAFYNLLKSFTLGQPLTREEFDQALQAAPVLVKGRGINHQIDTIWNAINEYVNANHEAILNNSGQKWLIDWRNTNKPDKTFMENAEQRFDGLFRKPADDAQKLTHLIEVHLPSNPQDGAILTLVQERTEAVIANPTLKNAKEYKQLAEKIEAENPYLMMFTGLMKIIAGGILAALSLAASGGAYCYSDLLNSGLSTFSAGKKALQEEEVVQPQLKSGTP